MHSDKEWEMLFYKERETESGKNQILSLVLLSAIRRSRRQYVLQSRGIETRILSMICQDFFHVVPGKKSCFVYRLSIRSGLVAAQLLNKRFQPFTSFHDILVAVCKGHPEHHPALRAAVRTRHTSGSRAARKRISCCIRRILTGRIC